MRPHLLTQSIAVTLSVLLLSGGCGMKMPKLGLPKVHKITVQQGNIVTQEMVDQLKPGMTRNQILFIMGDPVMKNPFNKDRWDYIYFVNVPGFPEEQRKMSLFFENDKLASFAGNYTPSDMAEPPPPPVAPEHIIEDLPPDEEDDGDRPQPIEGDGPPDPA